MDYNQIVETAYELFSIKDYEKSLSLLDEVDELLNGDKNLKLTDEEREIFQVSLLNLKGFNYLGLNDIEKAIEMYETALKINPKSSQACAGLGEIFYLQFKDDEAKVMFEWAVDNNSENVFALSGLEKVNKNLGLPTDHNTLHIETTINKRDRFNHLITEAYDEFENRNYYGSLIKISDAEKLINVITESKDAMIKMATLENFKGFNFLSLQNFNSASKCFYKSLELNSGSSQAAAGLAEIFYLSDMYGESKDMYELAIKNNTKNQFALSGLVKVNKHLGLKEEHNNLAQFN